MDNVVILIPSLNPDDRLLNLIEDLHKERLNNIVIVNDGSKLSFNNIFEQAQKMDCIICTNKENLGKGASLKIGVKYIKENIPNVKGIITADSDGQHTAKDIKKVAKALLEYDEVILGCRNFKDKKIPLPSKIGNSFSTFYFKIITGITLKDTQTGLRGIPSKYFNFALNIEGNRYEYEMRFLETMPKKNISFKTVDIETIYEENRVTHFKFIKDSYIIYKSFFRNIISAISSAIIDISFFMIFSRLLKTENYIILSTILARLISGLYNFIINKFWAFDKKNSNNLKKEALKYIALFLAQMLVSAVTTQAIENLFSGNVSILIIKIFVDLVIFIINFVIQKNWIFKERDENEK